MKQIFALCLALSVIGLTSIGCDHCMLKKESTETTSEGKTTTTESQAAESSAAP